MKYTLSETDQEGRPVRMQETAPTRWLAADLANLSLRTRYGATLKEGQAVREQLHTQPLGTEVTDPRSGVTFRLGQI